MSLSVSNDSCGLNLTNSTEELSDWVLSWVEWKTTDEKSWGLNNSVGFNWSWASGLSTEIASSSWHWVTLCSGFTSGFFNLDLSSEMLSSGKFKSSIQSWSSTELDESDSFWFSIGSHEKGNIENLSTWLEQSSDIRIISVEGESLDTDFEFSGFIIFSVLNWCFYFLGNNFLWGLSDWSDLGWLLLFFFFWWFYFLCNFFGLSLGDWLDLLFTWWLFAFYDFLFWGHWFLEWRFSNWRFSNWSLLGDWLLWGFFFWFFRWWFDNLLGWLGSSLDWGNDFLWSLNLLFWAFFTGLLGFLLWNNSFLDWWLGLDNLLWGFFFTFFRRRFLLFGFLWGTILSFEGFDWLFLDLLGLLVHGGLWSFSWGLIGFGFGDGGFFFLAGLLWLRFLFGLFFGVDLFFFRDDQGEWAWWVFFRVLG